MYIYIFIMISEKILLPFSKNDKIYLNNNIYGRIRPQTEMIKADRTFSSSH